MKIELKNLKIAASLSEETTAFTATVYVDGKPAFLMSNHGTGGPNETYPVRGYDGPTEKQVNEWLAENEPPVGPYDADPAERALYDNGDLCDLDTLVDRLMGQAEDTKQFNRMLTKTSVLEDGKIMSWSKTKLPPTPANLERVRGWIAEGKIKGELINGGSDELLARAKVAFGIKAEDTHEHVLERLRSNALTAADAKYLLAREQRAEKPCPDVMAHLKEVIAEGEARQAEYSRQMEERRKAVA